MSLLKFCIFIVVLIIFETKCSHGARRKTSPAPPSPPPPSIYSGTGALRRHNDSVILIGAFNMRKFGLPKISNSSILDILVKIATRYDLLAVSEITDRTESAMKRFMGRINDVSQYPYHYVISDRVGRTHNKEQYAFIYRPEVISIHNHFLYHDAPKDSFAREPHVAEARIKGYGDEIALVNIHVKPADAVQEIDSLVEVQDFIEQKLKIKNVLMLGDFNADCGYVPKKSWKDIRLRTMHRFTWLIKDEVDTTVGKTNCAYDRIVTSGPLFEKAVDPSSAQPFLFDKYFSLDEQTALQVSDHFPVEVALVNPNPAKLQSHRLSKSVMFNTNRTDEFLPLFSNNSISDASNNDTTPFHYEEIEETDQRNANDTTIGDMKNANESLPSANTSLTTRLTNWAKSIYCILF